METPEQLVQRLIREEVSIAPYHPAWPESFRQEKKHRVVEPFATDAQQHFDSAAPAAQLGRSATQITAAMPDGKSMGQLLKTIRQLVAEDKYVVGQHASERLEERGIMEWQAVVGLEDGELIAERPEAQSDRGGSRILTRRHRIQGRLVTSESEWCGQTRDRPLYRQRLAMRIPGERIKRTRLIQTEKYVVAVEVEMVLPVDDPSEPCYESETVQFLRDVKQYAERGDVAWLSKHGRVYAAMEPA